MIPVCQTLIWGLPSSVSPAFRTSKTRELPARSVFVKTFFHSDKLCVISWRWAGRNPPVENTFTENVQNQYSDLTYWVLKTKTSFGLGSENSFWEHIKPLLPQTMGAECLSRSPEAPNTMDLLRECLSDNNRPELPREHKNTCRFFLKWQ